MYCIYLKYFSCFRQIKKFYFHSGRCVGAWMSELACNYPCKANRLCQISQHHCFQLAPLKVFFILTDVRNVLLADISTPGMKCLSSRTPHTHVVHYRHRTCHHLCFEQTNHVLFSDVLDQFTLLLVLTNAFCSEIIIAVYIEITL